MQQLLAVEDVLVQLPNALLCRLVLVGQAPVAIPQLAEVVQSDPQERLTHTRRRMPRPLRMNRAACARARVPHPS